MYCVCPTRNVQIQRAAFCAGQGRCLDSAYPPVFNVPVVISGLCSPRQLICYLVTSANIIILFAVVLVYAVGNIRTLLFNGDQQ
jgi:hypothetical protein